MGSSGTGKFTDYSNNAKDVNGATKKGSSGDDPCGNGFVTILEEVERCPYFQRHKSLPSKGATIRVVMAGRVAVESAGLIIGYLPTQYNYLAGCINSGSTYQGIITSVNSRPLIRVQVRINRE